MPSTRCRQELSAFLDDCTSDITTVDSIRDISSDHLAIKPHILFLEELHHPVLSGLGSGLLRLLQSLIQNARSILWLTIGRETSHPCSNMLAGLVRCVKNETSGVSMQIVDIESLSVASPSFIAENFIRLIISRDISAEVLWARNQSQKWTTYDTSHPSDLRDERSMERIEESNHTIL